MTYSDDRQDSRRQPVRESLAVEVLGRQNLAIDGTGDGDIGVYTIAPSTIVRTVSSN